MEKCQKIRGRAMSTKMQWWVEKYSMKGKQKFVIKKLKHIIIKYYENYLNQTQTIIVTKA